MYANKCYGSKHQSEVWNPEKIIEQRKNSAENSWSELVRLGGRPSRGIRYHPPWQTEMVDGLLSWIDDKGVRNRCEEDLYFTLHWREEMSLFREELERWQLFKRRHTLPSNAYSELTRDLLHPVMLHLHGYGYQKPLLDHLTRIADWRAFRVFHISGRDTLARGRIVLKDYIVEAQEQLAKCGNDWMIKRRLNNELECHLESLIGTQQDIDDDNSLLDWIDGEMKKILEEAILTLTPLPIQLQELEFKMTEDAQQLIVELEGITGVNCWRLSAAPENSDTLARLLHLDAETMRLATELTEWRQTEYQLKKHNNERTGPSIASSAQQQLWQEQIGYNQRKVQGHTELIESWRQMAVYWQKEVEREGERASWQITRQGIKNGLRYSTEASEELLPLQDRLRQLGEQHLRYLAAQGLLTPPLTPPENCKKRKAEEELSSDRSPKRLCVDTIAKPVLSMPKRLLLKSTAANQKAKRQKQIGSLEATSPAINYGSSLKYQKWAVPPSTPSHRQLEQGGFTSSDEEPSQPSSPALGPPPSGWESDVNSEEEGLPLQSTPVTGPMPSAIEVPTSNKAKLKQRRQKKKAKDGDGSATSNKVLRSGTTVRFSDRYNLRRNKA